MSNILSLFLILYNLILLMYNINTHMDVHQLIGTLPRPKRRWVLPHHKFIGSWNPLDQQLNKDELLKKETEPYNKIDEISMHYVICYGDNLQNIKNL